MSVKCKRPHTAGQTINYPFGYGLSYTDFGWKVTGASEENGVITVLAEVTNTGKTAGKEVIQLYYGAPQGKLGKPAKVLGAFKKTSLLQPGERQILTDRLQQQRQKNRRHLRCPKRILRTRLSQRQKSHILPILHGSHRQRRCPDQRRQRSS